jgi:hypothetical protein
MVNCIINQAQEQVYYYLLLSDNAINSYTIKPWMDGLDDS